MNCVHRSAAVLAGLVVLMAGCASGDGASSAAAFPTGRYQHQDLVAVFNPDHTFVGTTVTGEDWVKGTYSVSGNQITLTDTWEGAAIADGKCLGQPGRYTWTKTNNVLVAVAVDDPCEARKAGTSGVAWTKL